MAWIDNRQHFFCCFRHEPDPRESKHGWIWEPDPPERNHKGRICETRAQKYAREINNERQGIIFFVYGRPYEPEPYIPKDFVSIQFPIVRRVFGDLVPTNEIIAAQPMNEPLGLQFFIETNGDEHEDKKHLQERQGSLRNISSLHTKRQNH